MKDLHGTLYFRTRENGAAVFRIDTENKSRRLEMNQIAVIALRKSEVRPHGDAVISAAEAKEIEAWIADRKSTLQDRHLDDILRLIDDLKMTTHWMISQATAEEIEAVADDLLLTMHDLRATIVRKKADALK